MLTRTSAGLTAAALLLLASNVPFGGRALGAAAAARAASWNLESPDGRTVIVLSRAADGRLSWGATRGKAVVLAESPLGIIRNDQAFVEGLTFVRASKPAAIEETYRTAYGKRTDHEVNARERTISFTNPDGHPIDIILRAHDDGVAFRYRFPDTDTIAKTITDDMTGFAVPAGSTAWIQPQQPVGPYAPAYEDLYRQVPSGTAAPTRDGWAFPALFKTPAGPWLLVSESAVDGSYCGSHLAADATKGIYHLAFPDPAEGRGIGPAQPRNALPWTLPWRL